MKAAQWNGSGSLDLVDYDIGEPEPGWAKVAIAACGICGSDLHGFREHHGGVKGQQPGHEAAGYCIQTSDSSLEEGRLYAIEPIVSCGTCGPCKAGYQNRCRKRDLVGFGTPGGLAEQIVVPCSRLHLLPNGFDRNLAALSEPLAVGVRAMRLGEVSDRVVAIIGAGSIGLLCISAAIHKGAREVAITARHAHQAELARYLGAQVFDDPESLLQHYGMEGVDVVVETVGGQAETLVDAANIAAPGGVIIKVGVFSGNTPIPSMPFLDKELTLKGSLCYAGDLETGDFADTTKLLAQKGDYFSPLVTHKFSLDEVNEAFEAALDKSNGSIKVHISP